MATEAKQQELAGPEAQGRPQHDCIQPQRQDAAEQAALQPAAAAAAPAPAARLQELAPRLALLACAAMWGSYAPACRLLYESAQPPDAVVVMAVRGVLQASTLTLVSLGAAAAAGAGKQQQQQQPAVGDSDSAASDAPLPLLERWLLLKSPPLWMAALELGLWNFSATALQVCPAACQPASSVAAAWVA